MLLFPGSKINIGLSILNKREDGYHNLESVFYPIPLFDSLEFLEAKELTFESSVEIDPEKPNSVLQAYYLLKEKYDLPPLSIFLQKRIPMGAGLGGGSSNGAFMLVGLNSYFNLGLSVSELKNFALKIGSDCPFFIENKPKFVEGKGELLIDISISLAGNYIVLVNPNIHISTQEAFSNLSIKENKQNFLKDQLTHNPISNWKEFVFNDFEEGVFLHHPEIKMIKESLYKDGANFASMTGTGSTVFGIFETEPNLDSLPDSYFKFITRL